MRRLACTAMVCQPSPMGQCNSLRGHKKINQIHWQPLSDLERPVALFPTLRISQYYPPGDFNSAQMRTDNLPASPGQKGRSAKAECSVLKLADIQAQILDFTNPLLLQGVVQHVDGSAKKTPGSACLPSPRIVVIFHLLSLCIRRRSPEPKSTVVALFPQAQSFLHQAWS
jgi:hypothetical protein